ncbi:MAG: hypothetical protein AB1603_05655 [Chloroflexota bacterium]
MVHIELIPDLSHCVETVARKEFREATRQLLASGGEDVELQERIELLRAFLKTADFKKLRRESEKHLLAGNKVRLVLYTREGTPKYELRLT